MSTRMLKPVVGAALTSPFGMRGGVPHEGVDLAAATGTPIRAAAGGTVEMAAWNGGYGNYVRIDHGNGLKTAYGHASRLVTVRGKKVARGQVIALVGSTGDSTGPHLHFEVHQNGKPVDPAPYLSGKQINMKDVGLPLPDLDPGKGTGLPGDTDDDVRALGSTAVKSAAWLAANWQRVFITIVGGMLLLAGVFYFVATSPAGRTVAKTAKKVSNV